MSLARPGPPALPEAGRHGGLWLLEPPYCPRLADGVPTTPLSAHSHPRALQHPGTHGLGTRVLSALHPQPTSWTGWDGATSSSMSKISIFMLWYLLSFPFLPFPSAGGAPEDFQAKDRGGACNHLPALTMWPHHHPMLGCRLQSMLAGPPWLGGHHGKGAGEARMGCSSQGPLSCSPSGHPQLPEIPRKHCRGSQQHGEGMRNQDLAGKVPARAEKSPALLHPSARPVLGRGGRGVLALVMGTAWRQRRWWWPLSIPGSPITLPPPPTPPNAGFKELQGDGDTPNRLCQSIFFGDLMVTPLPGAALCPEHLLPTLL